MSIEIISEAGLNHLGKLDIAKQMVVAAKAAGSDIVKFQTYLANNICHPEDRNFKLLCDLALSRAETIQLAKFCEGTDIEFMSTPGDVDSLKFLTQEVGVKRIKIGSDDLTFTPLLVAASDSGLPIILSTGMANIEEIGGAIAVIGGVELTLLHCVSLYPCHYSLANLNAIDTLRQFELPVGYSDHVPGFWACVAAVSKGVTVIEKHFKLRNVIGCVDEVVSINELELMNMINHIRMTEEMLGTGNKEPSPEEVLNINKLRKQADGKRGIQK